MLPVHGKIAGNRMQQMAAALPTAAILAFFLVIITRRAWVGDDAYITFRTVDNLIHGYGLTWNVGERVQAYTHPLWMLVLSLFYFFTREIYFTSIFVSLAASLAAAWLYAAHGARSTTGAVLGVLVLALSNAYVDYSTSGLENPLSHLLLVIFFVIYFNGAPTVRRLFWLSLSASLAGVNRMDSLLLYAPALALAFWQTPHRWQALRSLVAGQAPFILWEVFSIVYYGVPFPNTAYAKLNTGVPAADLAAQGMFYLLHSLQFDPLTLLAAAGGLGLAAVSKERRQWAAALGILLYLAYTIRIGGDFMSGRFLTLPLLAAVILTGRFDFDALPSATVGALFVLALLTGLAAPLPSYRVDVPASYSLSDERRINDERAWYFPDVSLMGRSRLHPYPTSQGRQGGLAARAEGEKDYYVIPANNIGLFGYYAGPKVYVIDEYALADPLLARLPAEREANFYIGHFHRRIPEGYLSTLYSGKNQLEDENLARYYDQLRLLSHGPLFSPARWAAIWRINTRQLDGLVDRDSYRLPDLLRLNLQQVSQAPASGFSFNDSGAEISLDQPAQAARLALELDSAADFEIVYLRGGAVVARQTLTGAYTPGAFASYTLDVPAAARNGFDRLRIFPLGGLKDYHLHALSFP